MINFKVQNINSKNAFLSKTRPLNIKHRNDIGKLKKSDVMVLVAHPDDETCFFGFIPKLRKQGKTVQMVYTTSGDQGYTGNVHLQKGKELGQHRENELKNALKCLKVNRDPILLNFTDGETAKPENSKKIGKFVQKIVEKVQPKEVYSFGPEGITKHPDHIKIGEKALNAVNHHNKSSNNKINFFQVGMSDPSKEKFINEMKNSGNLYWCKVDSIPHPEKKIYIGKYVKNIDAALHAHASQFDQKQIDCMDSYFKKNPFIELTTPKNNRKFDQ